jgi:hypothetical protein
VVRCSRQKHLRAAPLSRNLNNAELVVRRSLVRGSGNDVVCQRRIEKQLIENWNDDT